MARCPTCHRRLISGQTCAEHGAISAPAGSAHDDIGETPIWSQPLGPCIGSGGFASVWEILSGGVLKVAHASHDLSRARLFREAEALGAVGALAVLALLGHGVLDDGRAWIAMQRIAGTNLADLIAAGPMHIDHVVALSIRILEALARIHEAGFAHRDIKPDNIVRRSDGTIVILDLGLARKLPVDPDDPNRAGVQVGSVEYMAPEQLLDATTAGVAADLYAFGCILYELAAGRPPFLGDSAALERAHAALRPPPLASIAKVPIALEHICHDCLAKQPPRRPPSARAVVERLREVGDATAAQRIQHSMSVISEGTQPVVLVWAELPRVDRALLATLSARKIAIVSQRGRRVLGGVVGAEHADAAGAALAAARDLAAAGARVALHLDALTVTATPTGVTLGGASVERPEDWLPAVPWTGVVLTRSLARVTQVPTRPADIGDGFVMLGEAGRTTELFGRDALLGDLAVDAATAFAGRGPALALLIGDHGIGKTAVGAALIPRLAELGVRTHFGTLPSPGSGKPGHSALAELIGSPTGPVVRAVGDALREAARDQPTAIVLDDLHLAEHELFDAIEYATLGGEPLPLWILGLATTRLDQRRPGFGKRAERHRRDILPPLDEAAAVAMTEALLRPAEYPPQRAVRQIALIARGNPMHLATLGREIHDRGAIRTRPNGEHFLDTTALEALPPIALGPWLAARELASLDLQLVALARVGAVLGGEIDREELAAVIRIVEAGGGATTTIDVEVGLGELEAHAILVAGANHWTFRQALLEEGIYATTNEAERRTIHRAALEHWRSKPTRLDVAARIARHAEAVGERRIAAAAYATLGERAHDLHQALDADQAWQGAVRNLSDRDLARGRALLGRARARYRLQRVRDALVDLDEVLAIATELGDPVLEVEALLERATALDWSDDYTGSAAAAAHARGRVASLGRADLEAETALAEARSLWRARKFDEAIPRLREVVVAGRGSETETLAKLMLATALVDVGEFAEAGAAFDELILACEANDDRLHLGAAYANRSWLWSAQGEVDRSAEDTRRVIQIAREIGQAMLERIATYNLAESLLWNGPLDEALQRARRSLSLQSSHGEGAAHFDQLLVARILAARGERDELSRLLAILDAAELSDSDRVIVKVLHCANAGSSMDVWTAALTATSELGVDNRLELAHLAVRAGTLAPELARSMRDLATSHPIWSRRSEF
ncbi:MAG: protein kinase [Kofleriaceae bacterium]